MIAIPNPADMSDDHFVKHMNLRHGKEILMPLDLKRQGTRVTLLAYRALHAFLHRTGKVDQNHEHKRTGEKS